jgi:protein phosphatase
MANPDDPNCPPAIGADAVAGTLDELTEPLEMAVGEGGALVPGEILTGDDDVTITVLHVRSHGRSRRLYEARQGTEDVWLWESEGEDASRLAHEGALIGELQCPMFPRIHASFAQNGRVYLVTERCNGPTLEALIAAGQVDPARIASILSQVVFALTKLHAAGFAHMGLRSAAIVPGRPTKIIDFADLTRIGDRPTRQFYYAGYSPPELLTDEPADPRSDIYAVGAIVFHALGGTPIPETGAELMAWAPATPIAGVPQILSRCLGEKETRYESSAELHRNLSRLVNRLNPAISYAIGAATSIGLEPSRTTNQDAFTYCMGSLASDSERKSWLMACVADGMGGMEAGDVASAAVVQSLEAQAQAAFAATSLATPDAQASAVKAWIHGANERALAALEARRAKGGATAVCACLLGNRLAIAHVGDCRVYLVRSGRAHLLTRDHSLAMALVMQGEIDIADLRSRPERSAVTRSLGDRSPMPDHLADGLEQATGKLTMELERGDTLVLCCDGVWEPLEDEELVLLITANDSNLNAAADAIINATLARGGGDNATVVLVKLL